MTFLKFSRKKSDGIGFKFLIVSLLIIMFVIFLIGLQIGMVVEKTGKEKTGAAVATRAFVEENAGERIRDDIERMRKSTKVPDEGDMKNLPAESMKTPAEKIEPSGEQSQSLHEKSLSKEKELGSNRTPGKSTGGAKIYLQVGVFSVKKNADNLKIKLKNDGIQATVETFQRKRGDVLRRVLAGPYASPGDAEKGEVKIRRATGIKPIIVKRDR